MYGVLVLLSILVAPLAGWLADAKFGNYKVVKFGIWTLFLVAVLICFYYLIAPFVGDTLVFGGRFFLL